MDFLSILIKHGIKKNGYLLLIFLSLFSYSQNDLDAIRYSRSGINGTSRYVAMGGAFGALGADLSCATQNPSGLALFKKGEMSVGAGIKFSNNQGVINGKSALASDANFVYNNFGMSYAWLPKSDPESRNVIAFTSTQLQNFSNKVTLSNYTNNNSIAKDMLNIANQKGNVNDLNYGYEGAAFNVYVLDTFQGKYFSFVDTKRTVLQTRNITTGGRVNELNFSYAYSYKDQFYLGASLGIPKVSYTSTTTHSEADDKDSMKVTVTSTSSTSTTYSTTYTDGLPGIYPDKLGFNSLTYTEYFNTSGSGLNLKLGALIRLNEFVRVGAHYHTPTFYTLTDAYYYTLSATFDKDKKTPIENKYPDGGGYYKYTITTPSRFGLSAGFIIKKLAAIGLDYELVSYKTAQLSSTNPSDFAGVNAVIKHKYAYGSNIRIGTEFNVKPLMLRAGYNMQGSPFGGGITGNFVRHTISLGVGYRSKNNVYYDLVWYKNFSSEDYYMFTTINQKSTINYNNSMLAATIGIKFN